MVQAHEVLCMSEVTLVVPPLMRCFKSGTKELLIIVIVPVSKCVLVCMRVCSSTHKPVMCSSVERKARQR